MDMNSDSPKKASTRWAKALMRRPKDSMRRTKVPMPKRPCSPDYLIYSVPKVSATSIASTLTAMPKDSLIFVSAAFAKHFKPAPKDGHTYVVQDPGRLWVHHTTQPSGKHVLMDKKQPPHCPGYSGKVEVRTKYLNGAPKKKAPRHSTKLTVGVPVERASDDPPVIQLIDIERVMLIVGFAKSFIYAQPDFPEPVRLGSSRRAAVRWVASEVELWVQKLMAKRSTATNKQTSI
jgi:predicted DNA-binding transcriptional regulator AlpA